MNTHCPSCGRDVTRSGVWWSVLDGNLNKVSLCDSCDHDLERWAATRVAGTRTVYALTPGGRVAIATYPDGPAKGLFVKALHAPGDTRPIEWFMVRAPLHYDHDQNVLLAEADEAAEKVEGVAGDGKPRP